MSAKEVLADLFETITGDTEKRWPPVWMAIQIIKTRPEVGDTAITLAVEAGANEAVIDAVVDPKLRRAPGAPMWYPAKLDTLSRLFIDLTEQFEPELELAIHAEAEDFPEDFTAGDYVAIYHVYQIVLDQLEPGALREGGPPHPRIPVFKGTDRTPSFATRTALKAAAVIVPTTSTRLRDALYDSNPWRRAWAYSIIADYHGYDTFDDSPLMISGEELRSRWAATMAITYRPAKGQPLRYPRGY